MRTSPTTAASPCFQLWPKTQVLESGPHALFFSPRNHSWVLVNKTARAILSELTEPLTLEELSGRVAQHIGVGAESVAGEVDEFVRQQVANGIVAVDGKAPETDWAARLEPPELQKIYLELTPKCNLRCTYCYNAEIRSESLAGARTRRSRWLTQSGLLRLLGELNGLGAGQIVLSGGEPLLHPGLFELARRGRELGMNISLLTNGTLVTREVAAQLVDCVDTVEISLDSPREETNDLTRGAGSYSKIVRGIEHLVAAGHRAVVLKPVLSRANLSHIEELPRFAARLGCRVNQPTLCLPFRTPGGGIDDSSTPELDEAMTALDRFEAEMRYCFGTAASAPPPVGPALSCGMGKRVLAIDYEGNVYPCQALHDEEMICGNVKHQPIADIYHRSSLIRRLSRFSVFDVERCRGCTWGLLCGGGCRALAYGLYGRLDACNEHFCSYLLESSQRRLLSQVYHRAGAVCQQQLTNEGGSS